MANDRSVGDELRTALAPIDRHRVGNVRRVVAKVVADESVVEPKDERGGAYERGPSPLHRVD